MTTKRTVPATSPGGYEVFTDHSEWRQTYVRVYSDHDHGMSMRGEVKRSEFSERWEWSVSWSAAGESDSERGYSETLESALEASDDAAVRMGPAFLEAMNCVNIAIEV